MLGGHRLKWAFDRRVSLEEILSMVYHEDDVAFRSRRIRRSCEHGLHTKMNEGCEGSVEVPHLCSLVGDGVSIRKRFSEQ